ncbi:YSIRK-type signal peptide-containing protein, partial [Streptococcus suis]
MSKSGKELFVKKQKFSIRKLTLGVFSVLIGASLLLQGVSVSADEQGQASADKTESLLVKDDEDSSKTDDQSSTSVAQATETEATSTESSASESQASETEATSTESSASESQATETEASSTEASSSVSQVTSKDTDSASEGLQKLSDYYFTPDGYGYLISKLTPITNEDGSVTYDVRDVAPDIVMKAGADDYILWGQLNLTVKVTNVENRTSASGVAVGTALQIVKDGDCYASGTVLTITLTKGEDTKTITATLDGNEVTLAGDTEHVVRSATNSNNTTLIFDKSLQDGTTISVVAKEPDKADSDTATGTVSVVKKSLTAAVEEAPAVKEDGNYANASDDKKKAYDEAVTSGQELLNSTDATQDAVDKAKAAIDTAKSALDGNTNVATAAVKKAAAAQTAAKDALDKANEDGVISQAEADKLTELNQAVTDAKD